MKDARQQLTELEEQLRSAYAVCLEADGPQVYQNVLMEECEMLRGLKESSDYRELNKRLVTASFGLEVPGEQAGKEYCGFQRPGALCSGNPDLFGAGCGGRQRTSGRN